MNGQNDSDARIPDDPEVSRPGQSPSHVEDQLREATSRRIPHPRRLSGALRGDDSRVIAALEAYLESTSIGPTVFAG